MAILDVIKYGHPTLRKVAEPVKPDEIDKQFLKDMLDTMLAEDGVGLAANQVNVLQRVIVVTDYEHTYTLLNPEIIAYSENMETGNEGCLSLPGLQAPVPRHEKVVVRALNENGEQVEINAKGLLAIVLQHEIDHLNGKLYIDRADLTSLQWVDNDPESGLPLNKDALLDEIQAIYHELFHQNKSSVVFESQRKE
ncbi:peptide deformylase [candidate division KSB1 bacterium]|nr:peptide deformylase [candidate division KSB1 bacterium]